MKYFKKLVGKKVYLSPINPDDYEIYTKWMNDKEITDNLGNTAFINTIIGEKSWIENAGKNGDANLAIVSTHDDKLLGNISLMDIDRISGTATLGIFIGENENRSKGIGREAISLILDFGFNIQNLNNIDLKVFAFNERAINCYKKVGFKEYGRRHNSKFLNGTYHDEIFMETLKDEFNKK